MMRGKQKYFIIGHITADVISVEGEKSNPVHYLGGSVSYGAKVAKELGFEAHIITKCNPEHPYIQKLEGMGITVHCLPIKDSAKRGLITSFANIYGKNGKRTQTVTDIAEEINNEDLVQIRNIITDNSIIHVAPVIGEVDPQLFSQLKKHGFLVATPQGFFRQRQNNGANQKKTWDKIPLLNYCKIVVLSSEDIAFPGKSNEDVLNNLINNTRLFIFTKQEKGSTIYQHGKKVIDIHAFKLTLDEENDFTGAGDVFAAAFIINYLRFKNLKQAGVFASFYAALKIIGLDNKAPRVYTRGIFKCFERNPPKPRQTWPKHYPIPIKSGSSAKVDKKKGINTIPGLETVRQLISQYPKRVSSFLTQNSLSQDSLQGDPLQRLMGR